VIDVNDGLLATKLEELERLLPGSDGLRELLESFLRTASDGELVRINPVAFAQSRGCDEGDLIDLFLHARKVGLLRMEWHYVCPGCGDIVESFQSLTSATAHFFCQVCSVDRDADLSDFIEVTFSVSPEIRKSRYHDPWSLSPEEYFLTYRFTANGVVDDGTPLREYIRRQAELYVFIEAGETISFEVAATPGFLWFTNGPALTIGENRTDETRSFSFEYTGTRSAGFRAEIAAGPVHVDFTNATDERYALLVMGFANDFEWSMKPFLSGARLLSNQTFLDLFEAETIVAAEGLAVKRLALLFTDIQGSTALYDRIGDMKAFDLVRLHFGYLRDSISRNSGALVKTIGDAVMASFHDPLDALRAALDMHAQIARFNAEAGNDLIGLKVGVHVGTCLAVTLNGRLDYFGQAVNIAARVQALSDANEIYLTDEVLSIPGAEELLSAFATEARSVRLKGVQGHVRVHRVHPRVGIPAAP
jgi:class 3 adenylate cyclase